jgi:hypothetical protein
VVLGLNFDDVERSTLFEQGYEHVVVVYQSDGCNHVGVLPDGFQEYVDEDSNLRFHAAAIRQGRTAVKASMGYYRESDSTLLLPTTPLMLGDLVITRELHDEFPDIPLAC